MSTQPIPVFDPQGTLRDVPQGSLTDAVKAGGMPAVKFQAPDGSTRYVPASRMREAYDAGGKVLPYEQQDVKHPGFWTTLGEDLWGMVPKPPTSMDDVAARSKMAADMFAGPSVEDMMQQGQQAEARRQAGHGAMYSYMGAPLAEKLGVNVPGMEQSAAQGDVGGVAGHASAVPLTIAATEGIARSPIGDFSARLAKNLSRPLESFKGITPKQAAQTIGAATGAGLGHGTLSVPGAYYGAKGAGSMAESVLGAERANAPIVRPKTVTQPAPFPEAPAPELLQANALLKAGAPSTEAADALGNIPVRRELPAAFQGQPALEAKPPVGTADNPFRLSNADPRAVNQAITELGSQATIDDITARARQLTQHKAPGQAGQLVESLVGPEAPADQPRSLNLDVRTPSGESALRQVLTGQDNANLMKIAKSRGINVAREAQLKPGIADNMLINKIVDDFSDDELDNFRSTYLERNRMGRHEFGDIGPEANKTLAMQTYFPDVKIPNAVTNRTAAAIKNAAAKPRPGAAFDDLTEILQQSLEAVRKQASLPQ